MTEPELPADANPTSPSLLDRMRGQDQVAWQRFVYLYSPVANRWCRAAGLRDADADDVCQEIYRAVARGVAGFRKADGTPGAFRAWLRTVARNCVTDHYRARAKSPIAAGGSEANLHIQDLPDPLGDNEVDPEADERAELVRRGLDLVRGDFSESTWRAFTGVALDGRDAADVARELGLTPFAVRQANYRVRRRLREELDGLLDDPI